MQGNLESAVLRFSNQEGPTISIHDEILQKRGYVWWGWWKKEFEPDRGSFLMRLRRRCGVAGIDVALLNRKDELYYRARVTEIRARPDGNEISAPSGDCPTQYSDRQLPAWFKITSIDEISHEEYVRQFGHVPTGEPTLYEVRRDSGSTYVYPKPSWSMRPIQTPGNSILHISDLHFGEYHNFRVGPSQPGTKVRRLSLAERIKDTLDRREESVGAVVVTGDLVTKANLEDFNYVEDFLSELLEYLHLQNHHVVIVPGNHDFKIIDEGSLATLDYSHERAFRNFYERFYGVRDTELERLVRFKLPNDIEIVFAALNSARLRGHESKEYGYVGRHRYEDMLDHMQGVLSKERVQRVMKIGLLHHHVLPVRELEPPKQGTPVSLTVDAAELYSEFQARQFHAIFHGHQHIPFYWGPSSRGVLGRNEDLSLPSGPGPAVVACGASGASTFNPEFTRNTFGLYEVEEDSWRLRLLKYTDLQQAQEFADFQLAWAP